MTYPASPGDAGGNRVRLDSAQFCAGAVATAVVAALIALVGILICRWTLHIPILAPAGDGAWGNAHTAEYVIASAAAAIVAGGLLYLLVLAAPQPRLFFGWILGLATLAAVVYPFSTSAPLDQKIATAVVNLVLGIAITSLLTAVAERAVRRPLPPSYRDRYRPGLPEQGRGPDYDREFPPEPQRTRPTRPVNVPPSREPRHWE